MSDQPYDASDTPTIEVRIFRHDELVHRELCESDADAEQVVARWSELEDVTYQVDDLTFHHKPGDVLEPTLDEPPEDDYPRDQP